jgi:hypothetical protein
MDTWLNPLMLVWLLLICKHLVVDFFMQGPYQYLNKGTYGHPGGILHAANHGLTTSLIVVGITPHHNVLTAVIIGLIDMVIHYHIDWAKMNINKAKGWGPTTHEQFWYLLGVDQFLHFLTYWFLIGLMFSGLI